MFSAVPLKNTETVGTVEGRKHGVRTVLNAAPARDDLDPEILENTDILVVNQTEAEIISGISGQEGQFRLGGAVQVRRSSSG